MLQTLPTHRGSGRKRAIRIGASTLTLIGLVGIGVHGTRASFSDQVTMAQITVDGGTLELNANGGAGPNQAWTGVISANVANMKPGDEASGVVRISNPGTLPFTATISSTGVDAANCFSMYFRETSVISGATAATAWPVDLTGMGTGTGSDLTTAPIGTAVTNRALPDSGADLVWETDDEKAYTMTVRMNQACNTNGASSTLDVVLDAAQA